MKILIIQLRRLGDVLLTTPVLPYLKKVFPEAEIDFLTEPMGVELLENNPHIHEIVVYDKSKPISEAMRIRSKGYDVVIDFLNNPRSTFISALSGSPQRVAYKKSFRSLFYSHAVINPHKPEYASLQKLRLIKEWLKKIGIEVPPASIVTPEIYLSDEDLKFAEQWKKAEGLINKDYVVLVPIHRHPIRQWRVEGYREVGLGLVKQGFRVYLSAAPDEISKVEEVRGAVDSPLKLLPQTSLRKCAAIFKGSRLVVANDSGAMHLAVSVKSPTVAIYGPTNPSHLTPPLDENGTVDIHHKAVTATGLSCLGCELKDCPIGHLCMKYLSEKEVLAECLKVLSS